MIKEKKNLLILIVLSVVIGLIVGIFDTVFGMGLIAITSFRSKHIINLIPFLPLTGVIIVCAYRKIGKNSGKGMTLVFDTAQGGNEEIPKRLVPLTIITTWLTHLFGGSAGREGVAVQIGATVAYNLGEKTSIRNKEKIFIMAGMAAGFSGLFQTPIAAVFFSLEVLTVGILEYEALLPAIIAAFTANFTSHSLGLEKFTYDIDVNFNINAMLVTKLVLLGIVFGIVGRIFAELLSFSKRYFSEKIKNPIWRIFVFGMILSILLLILFKGRYSGLGTNLITYSFSSSKVYIYDWVFKLLLTIFTLAIGFQGGEVTPLFSIGATLGVVLSVILGLPSTFVAALGYAAVFSSATNTFLAAVFIGGEVFGYTNMPYFFVVCAISYLCNGNKTIYSSQK